MPYEYAGNLHVHTVYSDGTGTHEQVAQAALQAGLDFVAVTDHNVWVSGLERYHSDGQRRLLMLIGEEIHDQAREPQKNHLLVYGAGRELAPLAPDPQSLLDAVAQAGGLAFLAHPVDPAAPLFDQPDLSWVDWDVTGYAGLEIWNAMTEFKSLLRSRAAALRYGLRAADVARGPFAATLERWDALLAAGRRVAVIGGADAHALDIRFGPLRRTVFPYLFHFQAVNTHVLTHEPLLGDLEHDRRLLLEALRVGRAFVGYDLPAPTRGFRFSAQGRDRAAQMGEALPAGPGVTLQVSLPRAADLRILRDGRLLRALPGQRAATLIVDEPGAYRVEAALEFRGRSRAWIVSNPIYLTA